SRPAIFPYTTLFRSAQRRSLRAADREIVLETGLPEGDAADLERIQVRLRPAQRRLDDIVESPQVDRTGDLDPPPDGRLDLFEGRSEEHTSELQSRSD